MTLPFHESANERLLERLRTIRQSLMSIALSIARIENQDVVSARHIDDALQTLLPPTRRQRRRNAALLWAGVILGFSIQGLAQNLLNIVSAVSLGDFFGLIVYLLFLAFGILLAGYGNS